LDPELRWGASWVTDNQRLCAREPAADLEQRQLHACAGKQALEKTVIFRVLGFSDFKTLNIQNPKKAFPNNDSISPGLAEPFSF
jgi:hypothetical protein